MRSVHSSPKQLLWQDVAVVTPARIKMEPARLSRRLEAFLIDYMLCLLGAILAIWVNSQSAPYLTLSGLGSSAAGGIGLVFGLNHLLLGGLTGQTVGKMVFALRVIRTDGRPPGWGRTLGRSTLGYGLSLGTLGLGLIWAVWDSNRQAWHDKLFSTYVVKVTKR